MSTREVAKAIASAGVAVAAYLIGVLEPGETLAAVTTSEWLGAVVFVGGGFGLTYAVPNKRRE